MGRTPSKKAMSSKDKKGLEPKVKSFKPRQKKNHNNVLKKFNTAKPQPKLTKLTKDMNKSVDSRNSPQQSSAQVSPQDPMLSKKSRMQFSKSKRATISSDSGNRNHPKRGRSSKMVESGDAGTSINRDSKMPAKDSNTVVIRNLPEIPLPEILQSVSELVMNVGKIKSIVFREKNNQRTVGVTFANHKEAETALLLKGTCLGENKISVSLLSKNYESPEVLVLGVFSDLNPDSIRKAFQTFGKVADVKIHTNSANGVSELCSVYFAKKQEAIVAANVGHLKVQGQELLVTSTIKSRANRAVFLYNLPPGYSRSKVKALFPEIKITGISYRSKGKLAVLIFKDGTDVSKAMKLNGAVIEKHKVKVLPYCQFSSSINALRLMKKPAKSIKSQQVNGKSKGKGMGTGEDRNETSNDILAKQENVTAKDEIDNLKDDDDDEESMNDGEEFVSNVGEKETSEDDDDEESEADDIQELEGDGGEESEADDGEESEADDGEELDGDESESDDDGDQEAEGDDSAEDIENGDEEMEEDEI